MPTGALVGRAIEMIGNPGLGVSAGLARLARMSARSPETSPVYRDAEVRERG
jgi:hypothetical protein